MQDDEMRVRKRSGEYVDMSFDKILKRIKAVGQEVGIHLNYTSLAMHVIDQLYDGIETSKIDELSAEHCASLASSNLDYGVLAGRIVISNHQKNTDPSFAFVMSSLYNYFDSHGVKRPLISDDLYNYTQMHESELQEMLQFDRDYLIDYFGFKTLERAYLFHINKRVVERVQHMWLRVAVAFHCASGENSLALIKETYDLMSTKHFIHATPTLFNAGTQRQQMSSCYLVSMESDSLDGIFNTLHDCAKISKWAGGIGLHIHNIRAKGTPILGTNGQSNGIVPMLKVFDSTAKYIDQCLSPNTIVYTTDGPMEIQHCVSKKTKVFNMTGNVEEIENILEHPYDDKVLVINTMQSLNPLQITPEHPVYCLQNQPKGTNFAVIQNRLNKGLTKLDWVDAKDLTTNDLLAYPIPTYSEDIPNLSQDDCYMYGLILGDGCFNNNTPSGYLSLHTTNKQDILEFAKSYLDSYLVKYNISVDGNITRLRWNKCIQLPFRYSDFYDVNKEKHMQSRWINLPVEKSKHILRGLLRTDGSIGKEIMFDSTSKNLTESVKFILLKMGILSSGYTRNRIGQTHSTAKGKITNKKLSYFIRVPKTKEICDLLNLQYNENQFFKFIKYNNFLLSRIENITFCHYTGTVYDFQMKYEHNYLIHNGLVHNGGGRRNGSIAVYLEPWHADIENFLDMKRNQGDEEMKARDLFYSLWTPDLFMERIKENQNWSLFCPHECPGLADVYGEEFVNLYTKYEQQGKAKKVVKARDLWFRVLDAQMETGTPYICFKDAANKKNNQQNLGTLKSSNLCTEIYQYSDENETAVCNLASLALPSFVLPNKSFDYDKLHAVTKVVTNNLNKIIDLNFYPTEKCKRSNLKHRPIGIGVQGLADAFILMDIAFHSDEAKEVNKFIFETMYHASLEKSLELSIERKNKFDKEGFHSILDNDFDKKYINYLYAQDVDFRANPKVGAYSSFEGSPASQGILQFDMWSVTPSNRYDWNKLRENIKTYGLRNSLLLAPMPTASTSQILGFNECFEPFTSNIYTRRTLAGEFVVINKYLVNELMALGQWNEEIKNNIIANKGSVQQLTFLPDHTRNKYKIVWEIPMKHVIDMAADRGAFICQSQSMNLWQEDPTYNSLTSMHFYSWKKGLKTGIYYLRRKPKHHPQQFTIEPSSVNSSSDSICEMCSA